MKCIICASDFVPRTKRSVLCSDPCRREQALRVSSKWYEDNREIARETRNKRSQEFRETQTLRSLFNGTRNRALAKGLKFDLNYEDINVPLKCPILGTEFVRKTRTAMSIDRIDPKLGYTTNNVQIISRLANVMKNDASPNELLKFAEWINRNYNH